MLRGEFVRGFKCARVLEGLRIARATATAAGVAHPATQQALADYNTLVEEGFGDADTSALIALKLSGD